MIVGLHWREYTMSETVELLKKMGFETIRKYYFRGKRIPQNPIKRVLKFALFKLYPQFLPYQTVIGKKVAQPTYDFWLTDANT
jgi:hypothetical protein